MNKNFYHIYRKIGQLLYRYPSMRRYMPDKMYLQQYYAQNMGYYMDFNNPKTFSEKLQWLKLYNRKPIYSKMVDKATAKKYAASIIGEKFIIPTLGVYNSFDDIDFDILPRQFVMKCTHDSGCVAICKDKSSFDIQNARNLIEEGLLRNWYLLGREWPYKLVTPRIIVEQFINDGGNELKDYKFFCFNGKPVYCQVISNRSSEMAIDFFDEKWIHQPFHEPHNYPFCNKRIEKPVNYELMLVLASKLSQGHPFLRVDFYDVGDKVYFGELTFFPTNGIGGFDPQEWDYKLGQMINLPKR